MVRKYGFGKDERIRRSFEYKIVLDEGQRAATSHFVIYIKKREDCKKRIGISVGRKVGGAVLRNRIKRLFREAFRLNKEKIPPGLDIVVIVRSAKDIRSLKDIEENFLRVLLSINI